jgi:hypothetical protein
VRTVKGIKPRSSAAGPTPTSHGMGGGASASAWAISLTEVPRRSARFLRHDTAIREK